jgi:hypothetical protein
MISLSNLILIFCLLIAQVVILILVLNGSQRRQSARKGKTKISATVERDESKN